MRADLRAVVLTYGTGAQYEPLLESLAREGVAGERILVVHNPSAPGEPAPAPDGCEVILATHNLGYAAGMNLGIRRQLSRGCDLVLVLTHDARLREGALRRLVDAAVASPRQGVLGPTLLLTGTETAFSYGGMTEPNGHVTHRTEKPPGAAEIVDCDWVDGGTMLIRAEALHRVGCFDERFWGYFEDADLCLRVTRAGFSVGVLVGARADQDPGGAKRRGPWAYLITRNGIAYADRFAGRRGAALNAAVATFGTLVEMTRTGARIVGLREGPPAETWAIGIGTFRGVLDFYRRRWGPPPASLPGGGDIGNLQPSGTDSDGG